MMDHAILEGYKLLALNVLLQAIKDATVDTMEGHRARVWLLSEDAELYLDVAAIDRNTVSKWIQDGTPLPERKRGALDRTRKDNRDQINLTNDETERTTKMSDLDMLSNAYKGIHPNRNQGEGGTPKQPESALEMLTKAYKGIRSTPPPKIPQEESELDMLTRAFQTGQESDPDQETIEENIDQLRPNP